MLCSRKKKMLEFVPQMLVIGFTSELSGGVFHLFIIFLIHKLFCQPDSVFWIVILLEAMPISELVTNE